MDSNFRTLYPPNTKSKNLTKILEFRIFENSSHVPPPIIFYSPDTKSGIWQKFSNYHNFVSEEYEIRQKIPKFFQKFQDRNLSPNFPQIFVSGEYNSRGSGSVKFS